MEFQDNKICLCHARKVGNLKIVFTRLYGYNITDSGICNYLTVIISLWFPCSKVCEDLDPEYCLNESKILGDRVCEQEWFTSMHGKHGCKKTCNCCYGRSCTCNDRDEYHCKIYVHHYGMAFCNFEWFLSYFGKYGCKKSCGLCWKYSNM